jgi:hypothetical protein
MSPVAADFASADSAPAPAEPELGTLVDPLAALELEWLEEPQPPSAAAASAAIAMLDARSTPAIVEDRT